MSSPRSAPLTGATPGAPLPTAGHRWLRRAVLGLLLVAGTWVLLLVLAGRAHAGTTATAGDAAQPVGGAGAAAAESWPGYADVPPADAGSGAPGGIGQPDRGDQTDGAPVPPPVDVPPADVPPVDVPPVDVPPVDVPPVDVPPVDVPPVDVPPVDVPPVDAPPVDVPPVDAPPVDAPPLDEDPPLEVPPVDAPPVDEVPPAAVPDPAATPAGPATAGEATPADAASTPPVLPDLVRSEDGTVPAELPATLGIAATHPPETPPTLCAVSPAPTGPTGRAEASPASPASAATSRQVRAVVRPAVVLATVSPIVPAEAPAPVAPLAPDRQLPPAPPVPVPSAPTATGSCGTAVSGTNQDGAAAVPLAVLHAWRAAAEAAASVPVRAGAADSTAGDAVAPGVRPD
ncbi:hypothetical protein GCU56_14420 [Geodermatophilus sabuli]|uniref:Uncharacterized protein n=1 Tax=Geodermatophilus sabuli TaxID=1564158 RepID=A0A7K3W3X6_9ACTN|nr:hypothetical protein [Geodermatophilus sabuli]NEK59063.1 hypothetical protein [Geodermatophilus sabuli]